ncbi:MAG: hypothetical protein RBT60_05195 [Candidatus Krumholzibacteria bacterium]|nr:hypothetical protein [Candidatus Krumholzibacteria bacterium]
MFELDLRRLDVSELQTYLLAARLLAAERDRCPLLLAAPAGAANAADADAADEADCAGSADCADTAGSTDS